MRKTKKALLKVKNKLKNLYAKASAFLFNKLPSSVGTPLAALLIVAPLLLAVAMYFMGKNSHPSSYTVMVTNLEGTGGGSGSVIETSVSESIILTNEHVCSGVFKNGAAKIRLINGNEHLATGYVLSQEHDLCVISVAVDLGSKIKLAKTPPALYSEATVTGHPALLPNLITKGHFGGKNIISIMTGTKKCSKKDFQNKEKAPFCMFFGVYPVIKQYESQIISATIMPGSSGSAVLNGNQELSGVVFAGRGGLSYAYIVPFEAVNNFLNTEAKAIKNLEKRKIKTQEELESKNEEEGFISRHESEKIIREKCFFPITEEKILKDFCIKFNNNLLLNAFN